MCISGSCGRPTRQAFSWFSSVSQQVLIWFPRFQVATACLSCSPHKYCPLGLKPPNYLIADNALQHHPPNLNYISIVLYLLLIKEDILIRSQYTACKLMIKIPSPKTKRNITTWLPVDGTASTTCFGTGNSVCTPSATMWTEPKVTDGLVTLTHRQVCKYRATTSFITVESVIILRTYCYRRKHQPVRDNIQ